MNQVITLLEQELERQNILGSPKRTLELQELNPDYSPHPALEFVNQLSKAIKILKRHSEHKPEKDGFDTNGTY